MPLLRVHSHARLRDDGLNAGEIAAGMGGLSRNGFTGLAYPKESTTTGSRFRPIGSSGMSGFPGLQLAKDAYPFVAGCTGDDERLRPAMDCAR
ncbi:MAG: hypothetical protein A3H32_07825 [Betaproteobacteria bacterium RIFCSPLOWO2_02_FULL_63_19]|nr:MAG: hypothetical protein A3H32_07825 [Betaproteobacteria bacterium RIFCSPLOWO2_02_FULL_63_19]